MNFLLKQLFGARDKLNKERGSSDKEMPFLDHLEELRVMLMRIIVTVLVTTIAAYVFMGRLMDVIKKPVELANIGAQIHLPDKFEKSDLGRIEKLMTRAQQLPPEARRPFTEKALGEEKAYLVPFVEAFPYLYAALMIPPDTGDRVSFLSETVTDPAVKKLALDLLSLNPKARLDKGNLITMSQLRPAEAFTLSLKLAMYAGIVLALPLLLFFFAQFVFPGLTEKEIRVVVPAIGAGFGLFLFGVVFSYHLVIPKALAFFVDYADNLGISSDWRIGEYITFTTQMLLVFGACFELPVVVMVLLKLELISYDFMRKNRSYAIVILVTVGALITPTGDAFTLSLLSGPLIVLYEICIWMAYFMDRKAKRLAAEEEAQRALHPLPRPTSVHPAKGTVSTDASFPIDENDALKDDDTYEEGFEPRSADVEDQESDDAPDPYSNYDAHNSFYNQPSPTDEAEKPGDSSDAQKIDETPSTDKNSEDEPAKDDAPEDKPQDDDDSAGTPPREP